MISLPARTRIWIAAGVTDMRRGFHGLSAQVQTVLEQQSLFGHVFVWRGRRGVFLKILWFKNELPERSSIQRHRFEDQLGNDRMPAISQEPVKPGESYTYN